MSVDVSTTGKCVVAGNVRRTAEIAFGNPNDTEYIDLKGKQAAQTEAKPTVYIHTYHSPL